MFQNLFGNLFKSPLQFRKWQWFGEGFLDNLHQNCSLYHLFVKKIAKSMKDLAVITALNSLGFLWQVFR